jgi:cell wall-associated NlpC family hydrolase
MWADQSADTEAVVHLSRQLIGSPYLWGGTSSKAVDCSGLVKLAWFSQGLILARDASQQARFGEPIDFNHIENLHQGDLLFFGRSPERITHVGIYLGNGQYIHASGLVRINSIDPDDPLYNITERKQLVGASRVKPSANDPGMIRVKDHGWY